MDKDRIEGATQNVAGKVEGAAGNVAGDAQMEAAGTVRQAAGKVQNLYGQAKDATRDATGAAIDYARGPGSDAVAKLVHDNPVGSLLVAAGVGFAVAMMIRPRPRRPQRRWRYY